MNQNSKKRILIFSLVYYPKFIGGAEVAIKEITDRLGEDFEFDMVTLRLDEKLPKFERAGNVNVYRVGFAGHQGATSDSLPWYLHLNKYLLLYTGWRKAKKLQKQNPYDLVWSMMATYNSFAALFFKYSFSKIPFLLTLQEGDPIPYIKKRALPLWPIFKRIFTKADNIQTISNYLADFAKSMGAKCEIDVVPNGVDVKHFSKDLNQDLKKDIWNKVEKKDDDVLLITASRLVVKNAVEDIILSLKYLPSNHKLIICGRGYEEERLRKVANENMFNDRVFFIGYVSHKDLPIWLKSSDIFIRPSLSEGFGNSFIEAMASRIPVIATRVGGISDFVFDNETGFICNVSDPKSISDKVNLIVVNSVLKDKVVNQAFQMVKDKYDWNTISNQIKDVFVKCLKKA